MTAVQSHSLAPWKPLIYTERLLVWLAGVDFSRSIRTPLLSASIDALHQYEYKGSYCDIVR